MTQAIKPQAEYLETGENAKRSLCTGHMSHRVLGREEGQKTWRHRQPNVMQGKLNKALVQGARKSEVFTKKTEDNT